MKHGLDRLAGPHGERSLKPQDHAALAAGWLVRPSGSASCLKYYVQSSFPSIDVWFSIDKGDISHELLVWFLRFG